MVYIIDINFNILGVDVNTVFIRAHIDYFILVIFQMEYELCLNCTKQYVMIKPIIHQS